MITRYQIVDPTGKVIDELNSQEEVNLYVATKRDLYGRRSPTQSRETRIWT